MDLKLMLSLCFFMVLCGKFVYCDPVEECVTEFMKGPDDRHSVGDLGVKDPGLDLILTLTGGEKIVKDVVRKSIREILKKVQDSAEHGKAAASELFEKALELNEDLEPVTRNVRKKAKEALTNLIERMGHGKRNMDDTMDYVARMKLRELLEKIRDKIAVIIKKKKLDAKKVRESGKWELGIQALIEKYRGVKAQAMQTISTAKDDSAEKIKQAMNIFGKYKKDLGSIWKKLKNAVPEVIGKFY